MPRLIDITNHKYSRLFVLSLVEHKSKGAYFLCRCDCGKEKIILGRSLRTKQTLSCGCLNKEKQKEFQRKNTNHGLHRSRVYSIWEGIKRRCLKPNAINYKNYGGRGISICPQWHKFENFFADMGHPPTANHSIDRIDNNGNYEPSNCRWATRQEQNSNSRHNRIIEFNGHKKILKLWAESLNIQPHTLHWRLLNWPIEKALTAPAKRLCRQTRRAIPS